MYIHRLVMLLPRFLVNKPRANTLDLNTSTCLLLNVFDEHALEIELA